MKTDRLPRGLFAAFCILLLQAYSHGQMTAPVAAKHSYRISIDGKQSGWERVEASAQASGATVTSSSEVTSAGQVRRLVTATELRNGSLSTYKAEVSAGDRTQKYAVSVSGERAQWSVESSGNRAERAMLITGDVVLLDKGVWHQYKNLLARYDMRERGRQRFKVLIPQNGPRLVSAEVEFVEPESISVRGARRRANRFMVQLADGYEVEVIAEADGTPLSIEVPSEEIKVTID